MHKVIYEKLKAVARDKRLLTYTDIGKEAGLRWDKQDNSTVI